jgi:hypothetical protein
MCVGLLLGEGVTVAEKSYSLLGSVLDEMAARRGVRGPYNVAEHVRQETGEGPSGSGWSQVFSGDTHRPKREVIYAFDRAFKLSPEELQRLAHVYTFDKEPPEGMEVHPEYAELATRLGGAVSRASPAEPPQEDAEEPDMGVGASPSEWIGERVRAFMEADEEVQGTLRGVTKHGVVIEVGGRRQRGPCYYSWQIVRWMYPVDRQTINEDR